MECRWLTEGMDKVGEHPELWKGTFFASHPCLLWVWGERNVGGTPPRTVVSQRRGLDPSLSHD